MARWRKITLSCTWSLIFVPFTLSFAPLGSCTRASLESTNCNMQYALVREVRWSGARCALDNTRTRVKLHARNVRVVHEAAISTTRSSVHYTSRMRFNTRKYIYTCISYNEICVTFVTWTQRTSLVYETNVSLALTIDSIEILLRYIRIIFHMYLHISTLQI